MKLVLNGGAVAAAALLVAASAHAADLSPRPYKSAIAAPGAYNWSGFYIGGQLGGVYSHNDVSTPGGELLSPISVHDGSFFAGGYFGYNWQASRLVLGVEGDFSGAFGNATLSSRQQTIVPGIFAKTSADPKWLATATARVGYAADNWLFYVKGGGAWEKVNYEAIVETGGGAQIASQSQNTTRSGWLVGAGIDYGWNPNWVSRLEYNYVDFGTSRVDYTFVGLNAADYKTKAHIVKLGLAYKFGGL